MGMLLALKNDDVFNLVASMDVIHNGLSNAAKVFNEERRALTERLRHDEAKGAVLSGGFDSREQMLALRPRMIDVNSLIEAIRANAKRDSMESCDALNVFKRCCGIG
jgi:hypothetical protein